MKKILLVLGLVSVPFFGQVISFEASEGYNPGNIHGQNGWTTPKAGEEHIKNQIITNEQVSDGTQSFKITKESAFPAQPNPIAGGFYTVTPVIPAAEYKMSFDVFFNEIGPNVYAFNAADYSSSKWIVRVRVLETGVLTLHGAQSFENTGVTFEAQKWYSIAYKVVGDKVEVYVNGTKAGDAQLLSQGNIDHIRFVHTNAGGSAYIDNIRFGSDATFAVGDVATKEELKVYPNPVKDFLNIDVPSTEKVKSVSIFSIDGKASNLTFDNNKADFSNLPAGVYVLQVETDSQTYTKKVIKK